MRAAFSEAVEGLNGVGTGALLRLCKRKGIENLHFHDLHHEATSRLFEKGLNPVEVATITGHKDVDALHPFKSRGFGGAGVVALSDIHLTVINVAKNDKWERKKRRKPHGLYCLPINS